MSNNGLRSLGLRKISVVETRKRLIVAAGGHPKSGKSKLLLDGVPKRNGVVYIDLINELEGSDANRWIKKIPEFYTEKFLMTKKGTGAQEQAQELIKKVAATWDGAIDAGASTLSVDDGPTLYELLRFAEFGRLEKVRGREYGPVNRWMRKRFDKALAGNTNVLISHTVKEIYKDDKATGEYKLAGWGDTRFRANVAVMLDKDPLEKGADKFTLTVTDCRHNTSVEGETLTGKMINFTELAMLVMPDSSESDWE